jgi:hypothetical protein
MYTKDCSLKIGIEIKKVKMTNHFHRASTVSVLAKNSVGEQQLIKLIGRSSS